MRAIFAFLILGIAGSASGGVIWFQNRDIPIATTFDGVAVNLENGANSTDRAGLPGGDANFVLAGIGITNDADQTAAGASWQPVRVGNVNTDAVRNLPLGQAVGIGAIDAEGAALSYAAGFGGSGDLNSHFPEFTAGLPGYIGFSLVLNNSNLVYGWMRVTLRDDNTAGGFIHEWAFEDDGGPIVVGVGVVPADYYVSTTGSDSNPGTLASPFLTIQYASSVVVPGNTVHIRAGTYREVITMNGLDGTAADPIVFQNYNGEEVVISGAIEVTAPWVVHSGNIWKTTLPQDTFQVFLDRKMMTAARWPNLTQDWDQLDDSNGWNPTPNSYWDMESTWAQLDLASSWGDFHNLESAYSLAGLGVSVQDAMLVGYRTMDTGNDVYVEQITAHTAGNSDFQHTMTVTPPGSPTNQTIEKARYYIEADLDLLDSPREWFYDTATNELYVWMDDSGDPTGRNIEARVVEHGILNMQNCSYIDFKGITLFSGAFDLDGTSETSFEDCKFLYSSYGRRMWKVLEAGTGHFLHATPAPPNITRNANPANLTWFNCEFAYSEGIGLYIRSKRGHLVENCHFHNSAVVYGLYAAVSTSKGEQVTLRRNTFHTIGLNNAVKGGKDDILELNYAYNMHFDGDFSGFQVPAGVQENYMIRYNWIINAHGRNAIRFDGDPAGIRGTAHHCVLWNNHKGTRFKGDQHKIYNLTALDNANADINVAWDKFYGYSPPTCLEYACKIMGRRGSDPYHGNELSVIHNNAANSFTVWPLPVLDPNDVTNNWNAVEQGSQLIDMMRDPTNYDFRPKTSSSLFDAGKHIPGITDGFNGAAPDIGAYESGDADYWIPGHQIDKAKTPVPPDGTTTARDDADLMWLAGIDALSHDVYFGTVPGSPVFQGNQTSNIFTPGALTIGQSYYWRIDTVTASGTITGDEWTLSPSVYVPVGPLPNVGPSWVATMWAAGDAVEGQAYFFYIGDEAFDVNGDELTFSKLAGIPWMTVTANGWLTGTPGAGDVGTDSASMHVEDPFGLFVDSTMSHEVITDAGNTAPTFSGGPFNLPDADEGVLYGDTIAGTASDAEDAITYAIISGPAWLIMAPDGSVSGVPGPSDVGPNVWTVAAMASNNGGATDTVNITVNGNGWTVLTDDDFEVDFGNWQSGGANAVLTGQNAIGTQNVKLNDGLGDASSIELTNSEDTTPYSQVRVDFTYIAVGMDPGENFLLQYSPDGGTTWITLKSFVSGVDFNNMVREYESLIWDNTQITFTNDMKFRFENDANGGNDKTFIDNIVVYAAGVGDPYVAWENLHSLTGGDSGRASDPDGDGFDNEHEYFFGMDPNSNVNANQPTASSVDDVGTLYPAVTYAYSNEGSVSYTIETSDDLATWTARNVSPLPAADEFFIVAGPVDVGRVSTITLRYNTGYSGLPNSRIFFRIVASE